MQQRLKAIAHTILSRLVLVLETALVCFMLSFCRVLRAIGYDFDLLTLNLRHFCHDNDNLLVKKMSSFIIPIDFMPKITSIHINNYPKQGGGSGGIYIFRSVMIDITG